MKTIMIALLAVAISLPSFNVCYAKGAKVVSDKEMKVKEVPEKVDMEKAVEKRINVKEQKDIPAYQTSRNPFYGDRKVFPTDDKVSDVRMKNPVRGD